MGNCQKVDHRTTKDNDITIPFLMLLDIIEIINEYRKQGIWNNHYEQKALDLHKCIGGTADREFRHIKGYRDQVMITLMMGAFKQRIVFV